MLLALRNFRTISAHVLVVSYLAATCAGAARSTPAGLWKTFDDRTHQARGTVRIFEENGLFAGRIESSYDPADLTARCDKCPGDRNNARVIGLVILRGMKKHGPDYDGGEILDPDTGSVYRCRFTLSADGQKLAVRGYLGLSLLGRTQTWTRVDE